MNDAWNRFSSNNFGVIGFKFSKPCKKMIFIITLTGFLLLIAYPFIANPLRLFISHKSLVVAT